MDESHPILPDFLIAEIFTLIENNEKLVELRCFGSRIRDIVDCILYLRFLETFGLQAAVSQPPSPTAFARCRLSNFAICHRITSRADTLTSIALKYGAEIGELRRLNNIISDTTFISRSEVYVPVKDVSILKGRRVKLITNSAAHGRPMWVLVDKEESSLEKESNAQSTSSTNTRPAQISARLEEMMQKALGIDGNTARYYLESHNNDMRAAIAAYKDDQRWDKCMKHLRKSLVKSSGRCKR